MAKETSGISASERIGALDRRVLLESRTDSQDSTGEVIVSWVELATVWAKKEDETIGSGEEYRDSKLTSEQRSFFTIRYRADVNTLLRLTYDGLVYDIMTVNEVGRRKFLKLECLSQK
jgi:SPP1 family predicted phage head-tail adaptor